MNLKKSPRNFIFLFFIVFDAHSLSSVNVVCKANVTDEDDFFVKTSDRSLLEVAGDWGVIKLNNHSIKFFNIDRNKYNLLVGLCQLSGAVDLYPFPAGGFLFGSYLESN